VEEEGKSIFSAAWPIHPFFPEDLLLAVCGSILLLLCFFALFFLSSSRTQSLSSHWRPTLDQIPSDLSRPAKREQLAKVDHYSKRQQQPPQEAHFYCIHIKCFGQKF
jgi:hypothetical protein